MDYESKRRHYTTLQDKGARKVKAAKNILFLSIKIVYMIVKSQKYD